MSYVAHSRAWLHYCWDGRLMRGWGAPLVGPRCAPSERESAVPSPMCNATSGARAQAREIRRFANFACFRQARNEEGAGWDESSTATDFRGSAGRLAEWSPGGCRVWVEPGLFWGLAFLVFSFRGRVCLGFPCLIECHKAVAGVQSLTGDHPATSDQDGVAIIGREIGNAIAVLRFGTLRRR